VKRGENNSQLVFIAELVYPILNNSQLVFIAELVYPILDIQLPSAASCSFKGSTVFEFKNLLASFYLKLCFWVKRGNF